jgi:two-component system response regulator AtoC
VDIRIIAATNRNLKAMVREKQFREDLYYRLDVQTIRVPPLRDHPDDIADLAGHFLQKFCAENGLADMTFASDALGALKEYGWPGNVRELWNVVQRAALGADGIVIARTVIAAELERQGA